MCGGGRHTQQGTQAFQAWVSGQRVENVIEDRSAVLLGILSSSGLGSELHPEVTNPVEFTGGDP